MIRICLAFTLLCQLLIPCAAGEEKHFLAVYTMPDQADVWERVHPDLMVESQSYGDFPAFLEVVEKQAGNRPIDLDLDMHGNDDGVAMFATGNTNESMASVGYLCNQIDEHLDTTKVTVYMESCYSGRALHNTMDLNMRLAGKYFTNHNGVPSYPIYGVGARTVSCGNMIYLQHRAGIKVFYEDIRHWYSDDLPDADRDEKGPLVHAMLLFFITLWETTN